MQVVESEQMLLAVTVLGRFRLLDEGVVVELWCVERTPKGGESGMLAFVLPWIVVDMVLQGMFRIRCFCHISIIELGVYLYITMQLIP